MSRQIFTVFDKVARRGNGLFLASNQDEAKRIFEASMKQQADNNPYFNPSDYTCFFLGCYQDEDIIREFEDGKDRVVFPAPRVNTFEGIDLYDVPLDKELE